MRHALGISVAAAVFAATTSPGLSQEAGVFDSVVINRVDADRARDDVARVLDSGFQDSISFPGSARFGDFSPAVPILLPMKCFQDLRAGIADDAGDDGLASANAETSISFSENGYFADCLYPDRQFSLTLEGTNRAFAKSSDEAPGFPGLKPDYLNVYGESASFGYAGADYLLLFECTIGDAECITENGIRELLRDFVLCSNDNECVNSFPVDEEDEQ